MLPKRTDINEHVIKLEKGKQLVYKPVYIQKPIELKALKTYIKTNLANGFIQPLNSFADALILFVYNPNGSL